jgi:hypothetical protein
MSDDHSPTYNQPKGRELKRPNTSGEVRTEQNFFKKNAPEANLRAKSPDINQSSKITSTKDTKDKSEKSIVPSSQILENESDERLRYLLKYGKVKKFEQDFRAIFAELPQISGIWIFYRKQSLRNLRPERLDFSGYKLNHIPLLEGEEPLLKYDLSNNEVQKIENLVSLPNLIDLNISHNLIREISGFESISQLKVVDISYNFIEGIQFLDVLDRLEEVNLSHNKIKSLEGLDSNKNLMVINLSYNNIVNLRAVKNSMGSVLKLSLKKNALTELLNIENFENVKFLKLSRNDLSSYQEILRLGKLKNLKGLSLYKNPIELNDNYVNKILTVCPYLESLDHNEVSNQNGTKVAKVDLDNSGVEKISGGLGGSGVKPPKEEKREMQPTVTLKEKKVKEEDLDMAKLEKAMKNKLKNSTDSGTDGDKGFNSKKSPLQVLQDKENNVAKIKPGEIPDYTKENFGAMEKEIITVEDKLDRGRQNRPDFDDDELLQKQLKDKSPLERVKYLFNQHTTQFSIVNKNSKDKEIWLGSKNSPAGFVKLVNIFFSKRQDEFWSSQGCR